MPGNPALLPEAGLLIPQVLLWIQTGLFFLLLSAVSYSDIRYREIPDCLQIAIAALSLVCFSPGNLAGILGAAPYLGAALFIDRSDGIGGGDVKLAAATGVVLGLPASLTASLLGLTGFVLYAGVCSGIKLLLGKKGKEGYPAGPFLSAGAFTAYLLKNGGTIL